LDKEGWREAPGWFEAAIPQLRSDSYRYPKPVVEVARARFPGHDKFNNSNRIQGAFTRLAGCFETIVEVINGS
jgi:hypothetical protein